VPSPGGTPATDAPADHGPTDHQEGEAADAIRSAENALAQQHSLTAQLDLQVVYAILNAHLKAVDGKEALSQLQRDIESAVRTRTDLDTAAGARDFQRFLLGKVQDIRALVAGTSLDDTSKSTLMAALTSLYNTSQEGRPAPTPDDAQPSIGPARSSATDSAEPEADAADPYMDSFAGDEDADLSPAESTTPTTALTPAAAPSVPAPAGFPQLGGAGLPGPMPGWGATGGASIPDLLQALGKRGPTDDEADEAALTDADPLLDDESADDSDDSDDSDHDDDDDGEGDEGDGAVQPSGPTQVSLPNGETITAANPKLAAAIEAAVNGTPIADAFREQGMTIPPPGTAVTERIDPPQLSPGDIGMFTDHHALSLGPSEALVNGQIQHTSTVQGPSFLGWEHPPAAATAAGPTQTEPPTPTPTRPAAFTAT
jgi:hypothetical protein